MDEKIYKVRVKEGDTVVELAGDKKFVVRSFNQIKRALGRELNGGKLPRVLRPKVKKTPGRKKKGKRGRPKKVVVQVPRPDLSKMSLKEIFDTKVPKRDNHKALLMSYYTNKVMGKREFRGVDLLPLYKEMGFEPPQNISNFLRRMAGEKAGLLTHGRKSGRYKITKEGIEYIHVKIPSA